MFGYIRKTSVIFIPVDVTKIVVTYYKFQDDWDKLFSHASITINDDYIADSTGWSNNNTLWVIAFGLDIIKYGIKEWKFKLFKIDGAIIGIVKTDGVHQSNNTGDYTEGRNKLEGYGLCSTNGKCYDPNMSDIQLEQVRTDDIVCMELDVTEESGGVLRYKVNEGKYQIAYTNVDVSANWTLAVGLYGRGKIQLLK